MYIFVLLQIHMGLGAWNEFASFIGVYFELFEFTEISYLLSFFINKPITYGEIFINCLNNAQEKILSIYAFIVFWLHS